MDLFGTQELRTLTESNSTPCVSIYLSTHVSGGETQGDRVRLRNLLDQAEEALVHKGMRSPEAKELLSRARNLPADEVFWRKRSLGLAIFASPGIFRAYRVPHAFEEWAVVNDRFQLKPILPLMGTNQRFLLLALSQKKARLLAGSRTSLEEIAVPNMPASMEAALALEDKERGEQVHSGGKYGTSKEAGVFHAQGGHRDVRKENIADYFRAVDAAILPVLREETAPLVLAAVDYLQPIFRGICSYPNLLPEAITGNPDYLTEHELQEKALAVVMPLMDAEREKAVAKYCDLAGTPRASASVFEVLPAAHLGKVDTLFVERRSHAWGVYDVMTQAMEVHEVCQPNDDDLLDLAAAETLARRGKVFVLPREHMPHSANIAALYRY